MKHTRVMLKGGLKREGMCCREEKCLAESLTEKNKSRSFRDAESLGLINKERINSQEQSLRQPEREIKKWGRNEK